MNRGKKHHNRVLKYHNYRKYQLFIIIFNNKKCRFLKFFFQGIIEIRIFLFLKQNLYFLINLQIFVVHQSFHKDLTRKID
jgi:hypothetical protein